MPPDIEPNDDLIHFIKNHLGYSFQFAEQEAFLMNAKATKRMEVPEPQLSALDYDVELDDGAMIRILQ